MEMAEEDLGSRSGSAPPFPAIVSLTPFSPNPSPSARRLSSQFTKPSLPVAPARRLAWVSLQGRLVNAEEASSARTIGGGLSLEEAAAWELFTPIQRVLIVAVIGVAVAESKKNRTITQLKKSVELRDQVLSSMQQKLDALCEQMNDTKDRSGSVVNMSYNKNANQSSCSEFFGCDEMKLVDCGCWLCSQHHELVTGITYKMPFVKEVEQEERRMSDLSDWASSVTSAADIQFNTFAMDQDISNLRKECEEKDATIGELTTILRSSSVAGSKRISELEDIIRRKNMMITRLKKDMIVLEEKVVQLTRLRRPSSASIPDSWQFPVMVDNIIYGMDSTTSPSSSDSDSPPVNRPKAHVAEADEISAQKNELASATNQKSAPSKSSSSLNKLTDRLTRSRTVSPLKEVSMNPKVNTRAVLKQKHSADGDLRKSRRPTQMLSKDATPQKRWA
ncbi:hypothetical protein HS088_TW23G00213 [Tripterygium wilfordii]|uniref:Inactive rhomboid protein n=1 Tax=Tripterygium wilfordii TaxID=458696 RepID=A0A7J7BUB1_TRIWF|nr:uncharacterized protein LOC119992968 [Tripterygium wilfordii]KAF5725491.1 hypothetical protein HS088_TW23G00213 [Tripterygium wilfordii]